MIPAPSVLISDHSPCLGHVSLLTILWTQHVCSPLCRSLLLYTDTWSAAWLSPSNCSNFTFTVRLFHLPIKIYALYSLRVLISFTQFYYLHILYHHHIYDIWICVPPSSSLKQLAMCTMTVMVSTYLYQLTVCRALFCFTVNSFMSYLIISYQP
jgi:hypothetical protein